MVDRGFGGAGVRSRRQDRRAEPPICSVGPGRIHPRAARKGPGSHSRDARGSGAQRAGPARCGRSIPCRDSDPPARWAAAPLRACAVDRARTPRSAERIRGGPRAARVRRRRQASHRGVGRLERGWRSLDRIPARLPTAPLRGRRSRFRRRRTAVALASPPGGRSRRERAVGRDALPATQGTSGRAVRTDGRPGHGSLRRDARHPLARRCTSAPGAVVAVAARRPPRRQHHGPARRCRTDAGRDPW